MKKVSCEVCGSTGLVKEGELFVCQECGVGYTLEDVKKQVANNKSDK